MLIYAPVVGVSFRGAEAKEAIRASSIGDTVDLEAEPENSYDPFAVKVILDELFVGYLARENNRQVSNHLLEGGEIIKAEIISFENSIKPVLAIEF